MKLAYSFWLTCASCFFIFISFSQEKKAIDHTVYDDWNTLSTIQQSPSGTYISYTIKPLRGDRTLVFMKNDGSLTREFSRGKNPQLNANDAFFTFLIDPGFDTLRQLKLDKVKKEKLPKDTLAIYLPEQDSLMTFPGVKSYALAKKGNWVAYLSQKDERPECPPKKKCRLFGKRKKCDRPKTSGTTLHYINPVTGESGTFDAVTAYLMDEKGKHLFYITSEKGKSDSLTAHLYNFKTATNHTLLQKQLDISQFVFDDEGQQLALVHSADTNKRKNFVLSYWNAGTDAAKILVDSLNPKMPNDFAVSAFYKPSFSKNGNQLFLGIAPRVEQEPEDTLLASEKARVDVWSGSDLRIQPQQLNDLKRDQKRAHRAVFNFEQQQLVPLTNDTIRNLRISNLNNSDWGLVSNNAPYQRSNTWDFPWKRDIYLANLQTGDLKLLKKAQAYTSDLSPSGDYFLWYEGTDSSWYVTDLMNQQTHNLTSGFSAEFAQDVNGNPYIPFPEGSSGWTLINNTEYFLVYSRYDIWALCPSQPDNSFCLTDQKGKTQDVTYRLIRFDYDSTYTNLNDDLVHGFNHTTKAESYASIIPSSKGYNLLRRIQSDHNYSYISKADQSNQILFRRMNFETYPDLFITTTAFKDPRQISTANPQQAEYNWGTVELVHWTSFEGRNLDGLLYKPEDFDSTKSYPMIVYFYEKYADDLHTHYIPKPTASIVYPTEYVSNGYVIFIPDITYTPGHPAASAYDCIVSGTDYLTGKYNWIDSTRLGLQGQSWGGYQTAQLITMTNKYKAAMAGAPVSNMFSAYGGIRWGSGLSRMFQYERSQSRIGYTIWEKPELYIENSPIFGLPRVTTPLLIMHNDKDGAVPWYQGIELYMGLRRLNKPVWMLNYNGDAHNLMRTANRRDLSIRMRQFFDHYLLDAEAPIWMKDGVPAIDKGIHPGLELKKAE